MKDPMIDLRPMDIPVEEWTRLLNTWRPYKIVAKTTCAKRSGYDIDNVREPISDYLFRERSESVSEHSHKFAHLWGTVLANFPKVVFDPERFDEYLVTRLEVEALSSISLFFTLIHDSPEGDERGPGDVPDNGCSEHDGAKLFERIAMSELLSLYPDEFSNGLMEFYELFEAYGLDENNECNGMMAEVAQLCKLCDKLEAIYSLLRDETRHLKGYIGRTEKYDNAIDFARAKYLGTSNPTDVWAFGLRKLMKQYKVLPRFEDLIIKLMLAAFADVRHEIPYCMNAALDGCD